MGFDIIPYQERTGNYNARHGPAPLHRIIPYQERTGNYNVRRGRSIVQVIIPYQERTGNYNGCRISEVCGLIIPYQERTGNYNRLSCRSKCSRIIPYQERTGNIYSGKRNACRYLIPDSGNRLDPDHVRIPALAGGVAAGHDDGVAVVEVQDSLCLLEGKVVEHVHARELLRQQRKPSTSEAQKRRDSI